ncbi:hypothetical protein Spith_1220 [Spirochaeta thermophila DSM 6578]|uniref:Uncharacterized protein n=1 Tax=Winmispira thermophila (strain ATCC 700085 / DSM 6578 / Z-1203) TaxID=869211 RepID=G0GET0_WINT7|nr:hypothetical protein [Spirochaeta thermophila]AEJ61486.1 hypothetical protein Spith_1220 [Spirochaeta thermophila DSM 6578]
MADERAPSKSSKEEARRRKKGRGAGEKEVRAKLAEMGEPDRTMAERLHRLILEEGPMLTPKTWTVCRRMPGEVEMPFPDVSFRTSQSTKLRSTSRAALDTVWRSPYCSRTRRCTLLAVAVPWCLSSRPTWAATTAPQNG